MKLWTSRQSSKPPFTSAKTLKACVRQIFWKTGEEASCTHGTLLAGPAESDDSRWLIRQVVIPRLGAHGEEMAWEAARGSAVHKPRVLVHLFFSPPRGFGRYLLSGKTIPFGN